MARQIVTPKSNARKAGPAKLERMKETHDNGNGKTTAVATQQPRQGLEHLDVNDFKMPYLVLLQAKSAQVEQNDMNAGEYWHSTANATLGDTFKASVCNVTKKAVLWAPRYMNEGVLAMSHDMLVWDKPNQTFEVQFEKGGKKYKWHTGRNVQESGLLNFGSSQQDNPQSKPAASLTYVYALYIHNNPELSPVVFSLQRSQIASARILNSMLSLTRRPIWESVVEFRALPRTVGVNTFYNNIFMHQGFTDNPEYSNENESVRLAIMKIVRMNWLEIGRQQANTKQETEQALDDTIPF